MVLLRKLKFFLRSITLCWLSSEKAISLRFLLWAYIASRVEDLLISACVPYLKISSVKRSFKPSCIIIFLWYYICTMYISKIFCTALFSSLLQEAKLFSQRLELSAICRLPDAFAFCILSFLPLMDSLQDDSLCFLAKVWKAHSCLFKNYKTSLN